MATRRTYTAVQLRGMLRLRCAPPGWAMFEEVHNGTGGAHRRSADALAMSLWPSRGLEVHGFEIKVDRRDWMRERNEPAKAESIGRYCDRWWLVVADESIVKDGELPPTWGLLVPRGKALHTVKEAEKLEPAPLDRSFVAALLRRAHEALKDMVPRAEIAQQIADAVERGREWAKDESPIGRQFGALQLSVQRFEEASGIKIDHYNGANIGEAFKRWQVAQHEIRWNKSRLAQIARTAEQILESARKELTELGGED